MTSGFYNYGNAVNTFTSFDQLRALGMAPSPEVAEVFNTSKNTEL
jgi:hypothetical protein